MTGRAVEFEIFCVHLECDACHKPIHKGFMYFRSCVGCHRIDADVYCDTCCPSWLCEAAIANRGRIGVPSPSQGEGSGEVVETQNVASPISPAVIPHAMTEKEPS